MRLREEASSSLLQLQRLFTLEKMAAVSRTVAAAVLLTCFLFGMLLAMTGVGRPPAKSTLPPHNEPNQLRGANDVDLRSKVSYGYSSEVNSRVIFFRPTFFSGDHVMVWSREKDNAAHSVMSHSL